MLRACEIECMHFMPRMLTVYLSAYSSLCRHKIQAVLTWQLPLSAEAVMQ